MAHSLNFVDFDGFDILEKREIRDFIEIFYRWEDSNWIITSDEKEKKFRGKHSFNYFRKLHTITLVQKNIIRDFEKKMSCGGNMQVEPPNLKCAAGFVLAHELQHANQTKLHKPADGVDVRKTAFYGRHQYWNRACERDARSFVDEKMNEICAYFGAVPPPMRQRSPGLGDHDRELLDVADLISECSNPTLEDVRDELRCSGILNPKNVARLLEILKSEGTEVII